MSTAAPRPRLALLVLLAGLAMNNVDVAIVNVATPAIHAGLAASGAELQLIVSGYVIAFAMLLITGARLGDMHGYRRVFCCGLAVFTVASLGCGVAPEPVTLIGFRIAQGVGAALLVPQVLPGIRRMFPDGPGRARALGGYAVALSGGAVAGQVLGGVLVSANLFGTGWRPIFLINVPIGVALLAAAPRLFPPAAAGAARRGRLDLAGVALLSAAVLSAVLPLVLGRSAGWPAWVWPCLAGSVPLAVAFVARQRRLAARGGRPLLNLAILTPPVRWGLASYAAATGTYFSMLFVLALHLQQGLGRSALFSGLALLAWVAAFGLAGPLLRRVPPDRVRWFIPAGYALLAAGYLSLSAAARPPDAVLVALLGIGGAGLGIGFSAQLAWLNAAVPDRLAADLSGLVFTTAQLSAVVGVASFGTLYLALPATGHTVPAFRVTAAVLGGTALLAVALGTRAVRAGSRPRRPARRREAALAR